MKKVFTVSKRWLRTQRVIKGGYVLQIQRETEDLDKRYFTASLRVKSSLLSEGAPPLLQKTNLADVFGTLVHAKSIVAFPQKGSPTGFDHLLKPLCTISKSEVKAAK